MARQFYSRAHYERVSPKADTTADIAERRARHVACEQANLETRQRFPLLTAGNFQEASDWQNARIAELMRERA